MDYSNCIQVVNLRHSSPQPGWIDIKCYRSTILGNPFELVKEEDRAAVVHAHKQWLNQSRLRSHLDFPLALDVWLSKGFKVAPAYKRPTSMRVMQELDRIEELLKAGKKVRLQCWCYPFSCHCDNYKAYLLWRISR